MHRDTVELARGKKLRRNTVEYMPWSWIREIVTKMVIQITGSVSIKEVSEAVGAGSWSVVGSLAASAWASILLKVSRAHSCSCWQKTRGSDQSIKSCVDQWTSRKSNQSSEKRLYQSMTTKQVEQSIDETHGVPYLQATQFLINELADFMQRLHFGEEFIVLQLTPLVELPVSGHLGCSPRSHIVQNEIFSWQQNCRK